MTTKSHSKKSSLPSHPLTAFSINQRVQLDDSYGSKGTIRYMGNLINQSVSIQFIGVEWDQAVGKNDGSVIHDDVTHRYFTCLDKFGSFVRHQRLLPCKSINQSMMDKYCLELDPLHRDALILRARNGNKLFSINIEFKGLEDLQAINQSINRMNEMEHASLIGLQIANADIDSINQSVITITPNIIELDLSDNLIRDWLIVSQLIEPLRKLKTLKLSRNNLLPFRLIDFTCESINQSLVFQRLRVLVLTEVSHAWQSIILAQIGENQSFNQLDELHISKNDLRQISKIEIEPDFATFINQSIGRLMGSSESVDQSVNQSANQSTNHSPSQSISHIHSNSFTLTKSLLAKLFPSLRVLDLSFNSLSDWQEVLTLASLPRLSTLILGHNQLVDLHCENTDFPHLSHLFLSDNNLKSFESFDQLSRLPSLIDIRILRNSGLDIASNHVMSTLRAQAIARIPKLQFLNGSDISRRERLDADKFYFKFAQHAWAERSSGQSDIPIQQMFPRYEALARLYGEDMPHSGSAAHIGTSASAAQSQASSSNQISVILEVHNDDDSVKTTQTKKVLRTMKMSVLRVLLDKLAGVRPIDRNGWILKVDEHGTGTQWQECDDMMKPLSYYDVTEGSKIALSKS